MKYSIAVGLVSLLLVAGCVQVGQQGGNGQEGGVKPTVVFKPADSAYLLSCVSELQGMKRKEFLRNYKEISGRLDKGDDEDKLRFICLSLSPRASARQLNRGGKVLEQYIQEHPDSGDDLAGLLLLTRRLAHVRGVSGAEYKKLVARRDELTAQVESLQQQAAIDKGRIEELQRQIDQLKNIESIIKSREKQK